MKRIEIGLIGDFNSSVTAHKAIPASLQLSSEKSGIQIRFEWVETESIGNEESLKRFDGLWCVPGSPYKNTEGALTGIKYARENKIPFLGTCGGFQHALIEYFRNVLQMNGAGHTEIDPSSEYPLITRLSCSLVEKDATVFFKEGTLVSKIYGSPSAEETYHCSYGFNQSYINMLRKSYLKVSGKDKEGDVRILELQNHPFFILTLFQPERSGLIGKEHPLITAFAEAALINSKSQKTNSK